MANGRHEVALRGRGRSSGPRLRQEQIAAAVRRQGRVSVEQLALRFKTSHETIRRDLAVLAEAGAVLKGHGGAKGPRPQEEGAFRERPAMNALGKSMSPETGVRREPPGAHPFTDHGQSGK